MLDCKTVRIFAYWSTCEQSNKRPASRLETESQTGERRQTLFSLASHALRTCEARGLHARKTLTPRFTDFFTDFEKKTDCFAVYFYVWTEALFVWLSYRRKSYPVKWEHSLRCFNFSTALNREEKCDVTLPWQQNLWITTTGGFLQRRRRTAKSNRFRLAKEQLCTCITPFCTFCNRCCLTATWNFLISRARFMESVNTTQKCIFFPNLR